MSKRKLFLIFHGRFPSEKAASLFAAESVEAFAKEGLEVTLIVPRRRGTTSDDAFKYYSIENVFKIVYLPVLDFFGFINSGIVAFWASYISFSFACRKYLKNNSNKEDIVYSNEIFPLVVICKFRKNCFYEMHDFPESKIGIFAKYLEKMRWILIHNRWKLEEAKKLFSKVDKAKYIYEPNAVDLKDFDINIDKESARRQLNLPIDKKIVVYTGHLYGWKGVHTLALSAKLLSDEYLVVFVGGTQSDVSKFRALYGNIKTIKIVGHINHNMIPIWQKAADILVLPNTAKEKISAYYTSPMKLFEYMASGRIIVATRIPSILEILNDGNSVIVEPDDPQKMAEGIMRAESADLAENLSNKALEDVRNHTWQKRANRIVKFMNS